MNKVRINTNLIEECKARLLYLKAELLNQFKSQRNELSEREFRGDEVDLSTSVMAENQFLIAQGRLRNKLMEIEMALGRIENGQFGVCEETDELIETERLKAIPWTRLSIEGAEIREALEFKYSQR